MGPKLPSQLVFLAHLNGPPFSYVQQLLSEDGTKHSDGHIRSMLFQAKADSVYLHRGLELQPRVISRHRNQIVHVNLHSNLRPFLQYGPLSQWNDAEKWPFLDALR